MRSHSLIASIVIIVFIGSSYAKNLMAQSGAGEASVSITANGFLKTVDDQTKASNQAYYFFLGMCVDSASSPITTGRRIVENFNAFQKQEGLPCARSAQTFLRSFGCGITDQECYENVITRPERFFSQIERHENILILYNKFLTFRHFATTTRARLDSPKGAYDRLRVGNIIRMLDILRYAERVNPLEAAQALESDIRSLRRLLQQADTIRFKMHIAFLLNHNLMALKQVYEKYQIPVRRKIPPITESEANFKLIVARDFAENYNTIYNQEVETVLRMLGDLNDEALKTFLDNTQKSSDKQKYYDRIMTINDAARVYSNILVTSPLDKDWLFKVTTRMNDLKEHYARKYVRENKIAYNTIGFGIIRSTITNGHRPFLKISLALAEINMRIRRINALN